MKWDDSYTGNHEYYRWYDLLAGEGTDRDGLLGYVRETLETGEFIAQINDPVGSSKRFNNLEDAKNHILTYYVTQKLEGT